MEGVLAVIRARTFLANHANQIVATILRRPNGEISPRVRAKPSRGIRRREPRPPGSEGERERHGHRGRPNGGALAVAEPGALEDVKDTTLPRLGRRTCFRKPAPCTHKDGDVLWKLEAPPGFEPGVEVLQIS
jgi:hypothetical protein